MHAPNNPLRVNTVPFPRPTKRSLWRRCFLFGALVLACFAFSPAARAVDPPPDGGYPGANTAEGDLALLSLTTGEANTALGFKALSANTTGSNNTGTGERALRGNSTGGSNTATGLEALTSNTTGNNNTATGLLALYGNTTGSYNTAIGDSAGHDITGSGNVCIGSGVVGIHSEDNTTRIRNIGSTLQNSGLFVTVDAVNGTKLGYSAPSSRRYKDEIKPMDKASEAILALKPVTFRYKKEFDPTHGPGYGLIAEEVEKVNPDLVSHNDKGEAETVRYDAVNAMLLNEFLKEHRKMQEQEATIAQQRKDFQASITKLEATVAQQQNKIRAVTASLKEQASQIQKVSAQLELRKPAPRTVVNN